MQLQCAKLRLLFKEIICYGISRLVVCLGRSWVKFWFPIFILGYEFGFLKRNNKPILVHFSPAIFTFILKTKQSHSFKPCIPCSMSSLDLSAGYTPCGPPHGESSSVNSLTSTTSFPPDLMAFLWRMNLLLSILTVVLHFLPSVVSSSNSSTNLINYMKYVSFRNSHLNLSSIALTIVLVKIVLCDGHYSSWCQLFAGGSQH